MNDCKKVQELISAMLDGEISAQEREKVEAHIEGCSECRAMYSAFAAVSESLNELEEVPSALHNDIMAAVKNEGKKKASPWKKILPLAACLALVIFGSVKLFVKPMNGADKSMTETMGFEDSHSLTQNSPAEGEGAVEIFLPVSGENRADGIEDVNGVKVDESCRGYAAVSPDLLMSLLSPAVTDNAATVDVSALTYYCRVVFHSASGTEEADIFLSGERVYADFGDGIFLATGTAQEIRELINLN